MKQGTAQKISNAILSTTAGVASFVFSLTTFVYLTKLDEQIVASIVAGAFCLLISYVAAERPNSESARAHAALADRLLAVEDGDLVSPAPLALRKALPEVAAAVETLFSEVRASIENAHALGMYDPVTSLPNRLHFRSEADKMLGLRPAGVCSAMLFVDLDRFKAVNDNLGHARGDQLLVMVANRLRVVVTAECSDGQHRRPLLARLAGDEFTLFFPEIESTAEIERVARRVTQAIGEHFELGGHTVEIGASVGVAICPDHGASVETLMRAADIAMYRAKSRGGAQHCLFNDSLAAAYVQKVETEKALTEAVQRGEFLLAFQPQLSLKTGEIAGAEALLRWNHPRDGLRQPDSFIPVAESTGVISDIGDWVISEVAALLAGWQQQGAATRLAFNVSPRQLERSDFFVRLRQAFADTGVPLSLVELEFSETAAPTASGSPSTISVPASRTLRGCARCRWIGSSLTHR
jgi:diguanylate cyclase (GGDEF)-like protein